MALQSSEICVNAFIFDVVKTVGRIVMFSILRTMDPCVYGFVVVKK
jgi:hypothetical protein